MSRWRSWCPGCARAGTRHPSRRALTYADYSSGLDFIDLVPPTYETATANAPFAPYVDTGGAPAAPGTKVAIAPPEMSPYEFVQWLHPDYLYVRIVPMAGTQPVDAVSNTVSFRLYLEDPTPYVPPPPPTVDVHVEFERPHLPDAQFEHCMRVVENKFDAGWRTRPHRRTGPPSGRSRPSWTGGMGERARPAGSRCRCRARGPSLRSIGSGPPMD